MVYAGTPERIGGTQGIPLESMRLKHVRDGYEDFEWLKLLENATSRVHVMSFVQRFMRAPSDYTDDVAAFEAVRLRVELTEPRTELIKRKCEAIVSIRGAAKGTAAEPSTSFKEKEGRRRASRQILLA